ncbi:YjfB family protein [Dechloromonas sp. XY25]|uniref:YjfB family protein n=1 Tax=Dechloromonas hankyongensis TaxID=2908002 RepID=A0ABS9JXW5_9RHOO|nr:YjfB family protein [Dechloromonas hankyongensis]MCG2575744.1 YjfB family protein [Dechloromonas hankyongensis]
MCPKRSERKMDITSMGSLSAVLAQTQASDAVGIAVLKKALDIQEQTAMQLIQALPQPSSNPPNLGNNVDVKA